MSEAYCGPLSGIRVVNFGWVWAAPVLGHILADMGAEVIKVETRRRVDVVRVMPPRLGEQPGQSMYSHNTFRNQLSITLDLRQAKAAALARRLVARSQAVVENFRPGTMARYGLDYAALARENPALVMISLSAAGQTGPLRNITTYGNTLASLTGLDSMQGYAGEQPMPPGQALVDPINGVLGAYALLCALRQARRTGEGQYIDISQWEALACLLGAPLLDYQWNGRIPGPVGNRDPLMAPHGIYPCRDDDTWVAIAVADDSEWQVLIDVLGRPAWALAPELTGSTGRLQAAAQLDAHLAEWTRQQTPWAVTERLQAAGVRAFPCASDAEVFEDPHLAARGAWVEVEHSVGRETIYNAPWHLSATPAAIRRPAPLLGQDNDYVFCDLLGLSAQEYAALTAEQVIY